MPQTTVQALKGQDVEVREFAVSDGRFVLGNAGLAILSNFDVQNANAFDVVVGGLVFTVASGRTFDTGSSKVITADKWSAALLSVSSGGTASLVWTAGSAFNTEALAIASLQGVTPGQAVVVGYVTVKTGAGVTWTAGTDALKTGTGGTPATETNYYNLFGRKL